MKDDVWRIGLLSLMAAILMAVVGVAMSVHRLPDRMVDEAAARWKKASEEQEANIAKWTAEAEKKFAENGAAER